MSYTVAIRNTMLDSITGTFTAALYTGADYNNDEVTGGTYSRQSIVYDAAAGANRSGSTLPTFNIPGGTTITNYAILVDNVRVIESALANSESYTSDGTYRVTNADLAANNT